MKGEIRWKLQNHDKHPHYLEWATQSGQSLGDPNESFY